MTATELVNAYYAAFNAGDMQGFLALLSEQYPRGERELLGICQCIFIQVLL